MLRGRSPRNFLIFSRMRTVFMLSSPRPRSSEALTHMDADAYIILATEVVPLLHGTTGSLP